MSQIKVHILNFHGIFNSHIEIILEYDADGPDRPHCYYHMNRWAKLEPTDHWFSWHSEEFKNSAQGYMTTAGSVYTFELEDADPTLIATEWNAYWHETKKNAWLFGNNCAVAIQWFLTNYANIPKPNLSNVSWNHLGLGLLWPSFLPFPVMLPGRVMSNAKFYVEARKAANNPDYVKANSCSRLCLYTSMSLSALTLAGSMFALAMAVSILSGGIGALAIAGCVAVGLASTYCFFKLRNQSSKNRIMEDHVKTFMAGS